MKDAVPKLNTLNIAIVDDHNLFRKGLIKLINLGNVQNRYNILFEADNGHELQESMKQVPFPDIILMDIEMPDMNGFEAVDWLQRTHPSVKVMVISMVESDEAILRMLRLGVKGYLSKDIEVEDMHRALETIANNGFYYSDTATQVMNHNLNGTISKNKDAVYLSENEREFIKLAASDLTYQQIAEKMSLSPKTIDGYREALFQRLKVKNRVMLALYAVKHGIVQL
ncbi:response regulator transcription factor [Chitinophaga filiformis]|uniref:DNA-binding response regulator, NarL/FixJ family, contains REC and HTH domains n=1 Tax=Chitinophaga filiformis TaxID=104663 RepID=A0A1G7X238_CHIFI|nr:response regulator transcription factor [Chitinophaga filiformis]SDG78245.1 DNA-binding response regulator, NarL/FixJ family, contains REC and HTH domains [Chitinophaga filiformis]